MNIIIFQLWSCFQLKILKDFLGQRTQTWLLRWEKHFDWIIPECLEYVQNCLKHCQSFYNWVLNAQQCFAAIWYHWTQGYRLPCVQPLRTQYHIWQFKFWRSFSGLFRLFTGAKIQIVYLIKKEMALTYMTANMTFNLLNSTLW